MAKNIFETLSDASFTVDHGTESHDFMTPEWLLAFTPGAMASEEDLIMIAREQGVLHGLLHAGLQQAIIGMRAAARPCDKKGVRQSMLADVQGAQDRLDAYRPKVLKPPGVKKEISAADAIAVLKAQGLSLEEIMKEFGA